MNLYDAPTDDEVHELIARAKRPAGLPTPVEMAQAIIARQHGQLQEIAQLVEDSRDVDGAHHKQWFLAQIAAVLGIENLDQGIAP